jgi:hypothetical protein
LGISKKGESFPPFTIVSSIFEELSLQNREDFISEYLSHGKLPKFSKSFVFVTKEEETRHKKESKAELLAELQSLMKLLPASEDEPLIENVKALKKEELKQHIEQIRNVLINNMIDLQEEEVAEIEAEEL